MNNYHCNKTLDHNIRSHVSQIAYTNNEQYSNPSVHLFGSTRTTACAAGCMHIGCVQRTTSASAEYRFFDKLSATSASVFFLSVFAVINNTKRAVVCVLNRLYILCTFRAVLNCYSHARTPHMVITSRSEQHTGPNNSQVMCESKHLLLRRPAAADRRVHQ